MTPDELAVAQQFVNQLNREIECSDPGGKIRVYSHYPSQGTFIQLFACAEETKTFADVRFSKDDVRISVRYEHEPVLVPSSWVPGCIVIGEKLGSETGYDYTQEEPSVRATVTTVAERITAAIVSRKQKQNLQYAAETATMYVNTTRAK